jgi:hypothetical protein
MHATTGGTLFRVELIEEIQKRGVFRYRVAGLPIEGQSRQPLLDACREIKRILGPTQSRAGLFREGRTTPDLGCTVEWGAAHTVSESTTRFVKYQEFNPSRMAEAAE